MLKVAIILILCSASIHSLVKLQENIADGYWYANEKNKNSVAAANFALEDIEQVTEEKPSLALEAMIMSETKRDGSGTFYRMLVLVKSGEFADWKDYPHQMIIKKRATDLSIYVVEVYQRDLDGKYTLVSWNIPVLHTMIFYPKGCSV